MKKKNKLQKKHIAIGVGGILLTVLIVVYAAFVIYFNNHYWFGTTINGVDSAGKSIQEIEAAITEGISGYKIELLLRKNKQETVSGKEISLAPIFDGSLEREMTKQNSFKWLTSLFKKSAITVDTLVGFDENKLDQVLDGFACLDPKKVKKPRNAYLSDYIPGTGYQVEAEVEGNQLKRKKLKKVIADAIVNMKEAISVEENNCYQKPKIRASNKKLVTRAKRLNRYVKTAIHYQFGENKEVLDGSIISNWLTLNHKNEVILDQGKVSEFVESLATKYNTAFHPKELKTSFGKTVTIADGDYGWWMDQDREVAKLLEEIPSGKQITREPEYRRRANSFGTNDFGDTYVEINLTAQQLFFYKNGKLLVETDFVSGNLSKGYGTPTGAYGITYTERDATLRGEDYATPVNYWMPFNGGVGMHDANWRDKFGRSIYRTNGSHGCINLPFQAAKKIFENINTGDPVLVYELPGTEKAGKAA